ncbi:Response regulator of zinc sigma-54-dependent two-component system [Klebsiella pneumoniae]|uniref:Response regulator of zinc sigma-54-dependent two-component system n=1 Tax=Klebsiella pneumoniae TaxID=573 RepID=A0A378H3L5_KLEPN|nr:Response regulator of zinc sigma-54-dependent two-component system [Klebsiella pneumoniae]
MMTSATARSCRRCLRGWGYQVGLAHNGLQALEQIHQQVFDLVLVRYPYGGDGRYRNVKRD